MSGISERRVADRLRRLVLGDQGEITAQLQREVAELQAALRDPAMVRALIIEALYEEARSAPTQVADALRPAMEGMLQSPRPQRRRWPWLSGTIAVTITALFAVLSQANVAALSSTSARAAAPRPAPEAPVPVATVWQDPSVGFGLGQARVPDSALAREVEKRLAACKELAGARIRFSVKDGWVWLRGEATASGRAAADQALGDLGDGVLVVNQLSVLPPPSQLSAR